jgi:hypothetical protein
MFFPLHLSCVPKKGDPRRAPGENSLRQARSSSVHFGNSLNSRIALINAGHRLANLRAQTVRNASPSDSVAWLNFRMGTMQVTSILIFTPNPARPRSGPTKFWGTRLGLRKRPAGRTRMSEAAGRVCAVERTWPLTRTLSQRERDWWTKIILWGPKFR